MSNYLHIEKLGKQNVQFKNDPFMSIVSSHLHLRPCWGCSVSKSIAPRVSHSLKKFLGNRFFFGQKYLSDFTSTKNDDLYLLREWGDTHTHCGPANERSPSARHRRTHTVKLAKFFSSIFWPNKSSIIPCFSTSNRAKIGTREKCAIKIYDDGKTASFSAR